MAGNGTPPDFIIIGRTKCATTSLATWLAEQPEVFFCRLKEPQFFSMESVWNRGLDWYAALYRGAADGQLRGEGTQNCTHPAMSAPAAERIAQTVPQVRLIYLVRHPVDRLRSHYRQARIWGQESHSLLDMIGRGDYVRGSMYFTCLAPYIERFAREQILVLRMEDLVSPEASAWDATLKHLGLPWRPKPQNAYNVSAEQGVYRSTARLLRKMNLHRRLWWLPQPVRDLGRSLLSRRGADLEHILEQSTSPIAPELLEHVWEDISRLEDWLGATEPLWPRESLAESEQ